MYNGVFLASVKAVTLIFISGRGSAIHLLKKGNQVLSIGKELLSFSHAKKRDFMKILTIYTLNLSINILSVYYKKTYAFVVC